MSLTLKIDIKSEAQYIICKFFPALNLIQDLVFNYKSYKLCEHIYIYIYIERERERENRCGHKCESEKICMLLAFDLVSTANLHRKFVVWLYHQK